MGTKISKVYIKWPHFIKAGEYFIRATTLEIVNETIFAQALELKKISSLREDIF